MVSFINRNAKNCASYHSFLGIAVLLIDDLIRSKENVRTVDWDSKYHCTVLRSLVFVLIHHVNYTNADHRYDDHAPQNQPPPSFKKWLLRTWTLLTFFLVCHVFSSQLAQKYFFECIIPASPSARFNSYSRPALQK